MPGPWTQTSNAVLVPISGKSIATNSFALGSSTSLTRVQSQVMELGDSAAAVSAFNQAAAAFAYPPVSKAPFSEGQQSVILMKTDALWLDPGQNGNFTGAYSEYNLYQFVIVWRERNTVAIITAVMTGYYYDRELKLLADHMEARILTSLSS